MALPLLALAAQLLPLASAIPDVMRAFGSDKAADAAETVVGIAQRVTGIPDQTQAVHAVLKDPALQLEFEKTLSAERITFANIAAEAEKHAASQVTTRWTADMASDSRLSKNIRPMTLIYILVVYTLFALMSAGGWDVNESYVTLLGQWGMLIMSAYFIGRTAEKVVDIRTKSS